MIDSLIMIPVILLSLFVLMLCMLIPDEVWKWVFLILVCWPILLVIGIDHFANKLKKE